jgi:amino-acid N-acetyltransferase
MIIRPLNDSDWSLVEDLLRRYDLPLDGARDHVDGFVVAETEGRVVGVAGLEIHGRAALLRSVAVVEPRAGVGRALVTRLLADARQHGLDEVALLTTTAAGYFDRFGFASVGWDEVDPALRHSLQFQGACPSTAQAMRLRLVSATSVQA